MIRLYLAAVASFIAAIAITPVSAQSDMLGVPGPLSFMGQDYNLVWTSKPTEEYVKQAYIPAEQKVESFTDMILVEAMAGNLTPMQAAAAQIQSIEERKPGDPVVNFEVIENKARGEVILDFVVSDLKADPIVVEWNAYRYTPMAKGDGVALFAVSRRGYGEEGARAFLGGLGTMRSQILKEFAPYPAPAVSIAP
ncbi:hypothetical protein QWE_00055 [Agrobacterium albertimagni AOL15]|uniref:Uncharacterized protein n=1 Tax=Agrobacterium albertimagni AOL15 TaxID=1156935 RepID=K2QC85_9HYPH|nr:hypothetical protein [Agrobacterium albertimagni]EKF61549.1 hypothetical protein QWE_00055 [Agrobacterium albertimagni AOL15]